MATGDEGVVDADVAMAANSGGHSRRIFHVAGAPWPDRFAIDDWYNAQKW
jgi:hypothetical protein